MDWPAYMKTLKNQTRSLNRTIPDVTRAFGDLSKAAKSGGVLDAMTHEFIAMGIAVATRCDGCIGFHAEALVRLGATREQVAESLATAIQMGGGPGMTYAAKALDAFDQIAAAAAAARG